MKFAPINTHPVRLERSSPKEVLRRTIDLLRPREVCHPLRPVSRLERAMQKGPRRQQQWLQNLSGPSKRRSLMAATNTLCLEGVRRVNVNYG